MLDLNSLYNFSKEYMKETNELKYLISVFNDIKSHYTTMRTSIESETKALELFFKSNCQFSKIFMNDISSLNSTEIEEFNLDHCSILDMSMSFGNQFDLLSKIFNDEYEELIIKINKNFSIFNEELNSLNKYINDNITLSFKDLSTGRAKYKSNIYRLDKLFKEFETQVIQRKEEKLNDKIVNSYMEFEDQLILTQNLFEDVRKIEIWNDESLNNIFTNVIKLTVNSLNYFKDHFRLITIFKANLIEKILETHSITIESISALEILKEPSLNLPDDIQVKNLIETSENIYIYLNNQTSTILFKKKVISYLNKFMVNFIKSIELLIQNLQKNSKTIYNNKIDILVNKSYSYLNTTNVSRFFDFLKSFYDLFTKKLQEVIKNIASSTLISVENISKELLNEENMVTNIVGKFNKELSNYKKDLNKLLINKEKIILQLVSKEENSSKTAYFKNEETLINAQLTEHNLKFKRFIEDFISNDKLTNYLVPSKEFASHYRDCILSVTMQLEKIYSQLNDYINFREQILSKTENLNEDLKSIFDVFIKEYMSLNDENENESQSQNVDTLIQLLYNQINFFKNPDNNELIEKEQDELEKVAHKFVFMNLEDLIIICPNYTKELETILKEDELSLLKEKYQFRNKGRKTSDPPSDSKSNYTDQNVIDSFVCSYVSLDKNIIILGKLYITDKKIIFDGSATTINSFKIIIEIKKQELNQVIVVGKNILKIKLKISENLSFFFIFYLSSVNSFIQQIKATFKIEDLENIQIENTENFETVPNNALDNLISEENVNDFTEDFCNGIIASCDNLFSCGNTNKHLADLKFFEKIKEFNNKRLEIYNETILHKNFGNVFINKEKITTTILDVPICIIYKSFYDNNEICDNKEIKCGKNFIMTLQDLNKDYNVNFNTEESKKIPKYYSDPYGFTMPLLTKLNKEEILDFINTLDSTFPICKENEFTYTFTHPMKKQFMGPSKIDVREEYKVYFISPICLVVEIYSYMSGFMLMDTFYNVAQYKFESEMTYEGNRINYNTKVTVSFGIEFVKDCWFRNKIESNGLADNEIFVRDFMVPNMRKVINERVKVWYEEEKKLKLALGDKKEKLVIQVEEKDIQKKIEEINIEQSIGKVNEVHRNDSLNEENTNWKEFITYVCLFLLILNILRYFLGENIKELANNILLGISICVIFKMQRDMKTISEKLNLLLRK